MHECWCGAGPFDTDVGLGKHQTRTVIGLLVTMRTTMAATPMPLLGHCQVTWPAPPSMARLKGLSLLLARHILTSQCHQLLWVIPKRLHSLCPSNDRGHEVSCCATGRHYMCSSAIVQHCIEKARQHSMVSALYHMDSFRPSSCVHEQELACGLQRWG